jgi:hypothetical protein
MNKNQTETTKEMGALELRLTDKINDVEKNIRDKMNGRKQ